MKAIFICLLFISLIVFIIVYGIKSVYDLMEDTDDKQNYNYPKKSDTDDKK